MIFNMNNSKDAVARQDILLNKQTLGYTRKNLLKNIATTKTVSGITFAVNDDKSITVNGTSTAQATLVIHANMVLGKGKYVFADNYNLFGVTTSIDQVSSDGKWEKSIGVNGVEFEITEEMVSSKTFTFFVRVASGRTINNVTVYPMLRPAEITDPTYEPYVDDVDTRLKEVVPIERGGTGGTTAREAQYNLLNDVTLAELAVTDEDYFGGIYRSATQEKGVVYKKKITLLYDYFKTKLDRIFAPKTQLGGCYLKYENGKYYIGHDDSTSETEV